MPRKSIGDGKRVPIDMRWEIKSSDESNAALALRLGLNRKTVAKWRKRQKPTDERSGPKDAKRLLNEVDEMILVALRCYTRLPLDDCLMLARFFHPTLTRSTLYRCFKRFDVQRLTAIFTSSASQYQRAAIKTVGAYFFHVVEIRSEGHRNIFLLIIHPVSKRVFVEFVQRLEPEELVAAIGRLSAKSPDGITWLFEVSGPNPYRVGPQGDSQRLQFDEHLLKTHRIRLAPAYLGFWRSAEIPNILEARFTETLRSNPTFDLNATVTAWVHMFNTAFNLSALNGRTPLEYSESVVGRRRSPDSSAADNNSR